MDRGADDYRVALGGGLNACGHVGCITEHVRAFVVGIADHYRSGVDSNPYRKRLKPLYIERSVERRHFLDDNQPCSHGTFGIVFVRSGISEPSQNAIAQVLRNIALETRHRFGGNSLIAREDIAPFLGVELSRYLGRVDQIAEQDCQMAPLAFGWSGLPDLPGIGLSLRRA